MPAGVVVPAQAGLECSERAADACAVSASDDRKLSVATYLVLLCYEMYAMDCSFAVRAYAGRWQDGQWVSRLLNAIAIRTRIVAIECGT